MNTPSRSPESFSNKLRKSTALFSLLVFLTFAEQSCKKHHDSASNAGKISNLTTLNIQGSDSEEVTAYKKLVTSYTAAQTTLATIMKEHPTIHEFIGNEPLILDDLLPLFIKESRLKSDAISKTGAVGYGQLKGAAVEDVKTAFQKVGESKEYDPNIPSDNLVMAISYFSHLYNQVSTTLLESNIKADKKDIVSFTMSVYNMGYNKRLSLFNAANKPSKREDFANRIIKDLMKIKQAPIVKIDNAYNVPNYIDRFAGKTYSTNNSVIYTDPARDIILTKAKAEEVIRYVEVINALRTHLDQKTDLAISIEYEKGKTPYACVKDKITSMIADKELKDGSAQKLIEYILLDNNLPKDDSYDVKYSIGVSKNIIKPYMTTKEFRKYKYEVKEYNNENKVYLWSIVNSLLVDKNFISSLDVFNDDLKKENGFEETKPVIRQYLLESIIRFNQERRCNWSETASKNVWLPQKEYFDDFKTLKNISPESEASDEAPANGPSESVFTGKNYANASDDDMGNSIKEGPTSFGVIKVGNNHVKREIAKNGSKTPQMIIIHGTESSDINEGSNDALSNIHAHFYVSRGGQIFQFIASDGARINSDITYPSEITSMNHAGEGLKNSYGAVRHGSTDITYSAIGIEVESNATSVCTPAQTAALAKLIAGLSTSYKIPQKNILSHMQVAASKLYGRGRKLDLFNVNWNALGLINNYNILDYDIISGKTSPNMHGMVRDLKQRGCSKDVIKIILNGYNLSVKKHRELVSSNPSTPTYNKNDHNARATLEELEKKGFL